MLFLVAQTVKAKNLTFKIWRLESERSNKAIGNKFKKLEQQAEFKNRLYIKKYLLVLKKSLQI